MERCFSCAEIGKCTELYARKPFEYRGPYFPIFERFNPPSSSNSISPEGTVKVCELCHIFLLSQWQNYERQGVLESRRIYFTKRHDSALYNNNDHYLSTNSDVTFGNKSNYTLLKNGDQKSDISNKTPLSTPGNIPTKGVLVDGQAEKNDLSYESNVESNKQLTEHHIRCFVCGLPCLKWHAKTAYSSQVLENKEYFPFFEKLDPPQLSIALTNGATKICIQCESDLQKQWEHYESLNTDQMRRTYHITNEHNDVFSITNPGRFITNSTMNNPLLSIIKIKNPTIKCALCPNKVIDPYTVSWSQRTSSLCISNLKNFSFPTEGVMVDKQSEEAIICDVCHYFLSYQMQAFNANMTPLHMREYKLPKVGCLSPIIPSLNDKQTTTNSRKPVTLGSSLSAFSAPEGWQQSNSQIKRSKTPTLKSQLKAQVQQYTENNRLNSTSKPTTGNQDQGHVLGPIIANCHVCLHELRDPNTLKILSSVINEESPEQPYFPFLKTLRINSMKNYEFPVCVHCYHNLHGQWRMFQKAAVPIYECKYNHNEFMCTLCQHLFAQKTDTVIVRDKLLCVSCSENRGCEVTKNVLSNQDTDASAYNSLKTKTTVTVTPISNELSGPNLASLNYAEAMKQLSVAKLFEAAASSKPISTSTPLPLNTPVNQFSDLSRNSSSLSSDIYQNSKNLFSKSMKRPAVAAVAPNQRQNTPHEAMAAHPDLRMKMPDIANYHGNPYNQNSAFTSFSGNNNYPLSMFSSNSAFALHSPHSAIGRKSTKSERDNFIQHTANISNPYFDQKSRITTPLAPTASNPFINWTQQHHQPQEPNPTQFPLQQLPNIFDQSAFPTTGTNKEAEMTMFLYMMYQKQMHMAIDPANKFTNSWFNNPSSLEDMALNYYQSMMPQHSNPGMFPTEDLLSGSAANGNSSNNNGGLQSYMMNAAMANYQYNQMLQMLAAYQQHAAVSSMSSNSKPHSNTPNWLNQLNLNEHVSKRPRPDNITYDQPGHTKRSSTPNGFSDMLRYSELLKSSMGSDHEKSMTNKYPSINSSQTLNSDSRNSNTHKFMDQTENTADKIKMPKHVREDHCFSDMKRGSESSSRQTMVNSQEIKTGRRQSKIQSETDVLDLSQSKPSRKSSYAIDSLAELSKSCDVESQEISSRSSVPFSSLYDLKVSESALLSVVDLEAPLNMYNACPNISKVTQIDTIVHESQTDQNRLVTFLTNIGASSLINSLKTVQTLVKEPKSPKLTVPKFNKCPTILKFHKFLNELDRLYMDSNDAVSVKTRSKSAFMKELGLQSAVPRKSNKNFKKIESYIMQQINKAPKSQGSSNELYWTKWILKNLQHRLSIKMKPHLRRSLMRPVLSGDIEVRLCTAKHKHELETLRSIIKILIRFT